MYLMEKEGIKLDTANNKIILEKFKNNGTEDIEITLKNENISDVTAQNIKTALENGANSINKIDNNTLENSINNGNIITKTRNYSNIRKFNK